MITIGGISSFRDPEKEIFTFDDRQERIELIKDIEVQDLGRVPEGDVISLQCLFSKKGYEEIEKIWTERKKVTYKDVEGAEWANMRLIIKEVETDKNYPNYKMVTFELWRK